MRKTIEQIRQYAFFITLISTIPLFINYLRAVEPKSELFMHIHVWVGLLFFVLSITTMIQRKKIKIGK